MLAAPERSIALLLTGGVAVLALLTRWGLQRLRLPAVVGFLLLGVLLRDVGDRFDLLGPAVLGNLDFLADLGLVLLLFRVGLESDPAGLRQQLRRASGIWVVNVGLSGLLGFAAARWLLGESTLGSLFVAVALTATSVAVPLAAWRECGALRSDDGRLLLDVAALDDLSTVALMAVLLATAGTLAGTGGAGLTEVAGATASVLGRLLAFALACLLFARHLERHLTRFCRRVLPLPDAMLMLVAVGFLIAAVADLLGFSLALGAFFAGLAFSRDPDALRIDRPLTGLYDLFTPFFFVAIGLNVDPAALDAAAVAGPVLLAAAAVGKVAGTWLPAAPALGGRRALALAVSMVPRAEVAVVVMQQGRALGGSYVSATAYAAVVFTAAATCLLTPLVLRPLLARDHAG